MLTQGRLKKLLHYDCNTGIFTWKVSRGRVRPGVKAGSLDKDGYLRIRVDKKTYMAHRIAFLYVNGVLPTDEVDHIDLNRKNNKFSNLRQCTSVQNKRNSSSRQGASSKYLGVSYWKRKNKWAAGIRCKGKHLYLGMYSSEREAAWAYNLAAYNYFSDFANYNTLDNQNSVIIFN
jgi:hypothetical protein